MIRGVTFENQRVYPTDHGAQNAVMMGDGILNGCEINFSGENLTVGAGRMIICGRVVAVESAESFTAVQNNGYMRLNLRINTNGASTETRFEQVSFVVDYANTVENLRAFENSDINNGGTYYEMSIATVQLVESGGNFVYKLGPARVRGVEMFSYDPGEGAALPYTDGTLIVVV